MKNFPPFVFFLLLLSSCGPGDWQVYEGSEFTIQFPGPAIDTVTATGHFAGAKAYYEPVAGGLDSNVYYSVSIYSLPDTLSKLGEDLDEFLESDVQIYAWGIGGVLADSGRTVKSGKAEGREYKVTLEGNQGVATVRKFPYGRHLYTLIVVTESMKLDNSAIGKFMDSFKLK